jgi:hypothetical protein
MVSQRRRVAAASALSAAAGGAAWVVLWALGLSARAATALALVMVFGLAAVAPWRVDKRLIGLALAYALAFGLFEWPVFYVLALTVRGPPGGG